MRNRLGLNRSSLLAISLILIISSISRISSFQHAPSFQVSSKLKGIILNKKRPRNYYDDEEDNYEEEEEEEFDVFKQSLSSSTEYDGTLQKPSPFGKSRGLRLPSSLSKALLGGVFLLGIGTGVTVDSAINTNPRDLASRDAVDQAAPNRQICASYGASAMAFDQRVFVSFNPFNVYVAQADVKPACVLRPSNAVPILQDRGLINGKEVGMCKQKMNTWAYVGDLEDMPQISCVYQSEDAQNEFLSGNPKLGIGEDVWDDDRLRMMMNSNNNAKQVKDSLTQGQISMLNRH